MNPSDTSPAANSLSQFIQWSLDLRNKWRTRHGEEADQSDERKERWVDVRPFWKPWFRGQENAAWLLTPKLYRISKTNAKTLFAFEEEMRGEFKRRAPQLANGLPLPKDEDEWGWYTLMRHYGAPTRLLDWSDGALIGLYFAVRATQENTKPGSDTAACVWILDPYRLNLLSFYQRDDSYGVALPSWESAEEYLPELFVGEKLLRTKPLAVSPPQLFPQLSSQRSHFTVFGSKSNGLQELREKDEYLLDKIKIPADAVERIRSELELCGISEATIYPDLEALSRELDSVWSSYSGELL